jgi:citrate lyase subunit beta/citryl-CoA lyase
MTKPLGPSILFCPASRPERFAKAAARADSVILDLEDGMPLAGFSVGLTAIAESRLEPSRTLVRVRSSASLVAEQATAIRAGGYTQVVVPKCGSPDDLDAWAEFDLIAQVETLHGMGNLDQIADHPSVFGLTWGAEDLIADLGATSSRGPDGWWRDPLRWMRAQLLICAARRNLQAIDAVLSDFAELDLQHAMAADAARSGFTAAACVHPTQVAAIRRGFVPTAEEVTAADSALATVDVDDGAVRVGNRMVDSPLVQQATRIING